MNASNVNALARMIPLWLAPCLCLPLLLLYPSKAEPTPHAIAISAAASSELPAIAALPQAEPAPEPTTVHVVLVRGRKRLELDLPLDGKVSPATADAIARLMRCRVSGRTRRIATGTLALLADVAARFPGHEIEIISAVRAEPERSRAGIKHSKHWTGHAIDINVRGVKLAEVRDAIWKNHRQIGLGWYPQGRFIHLDYRPGERDTAWTQPRRNADNHYNPRWSRVARAHDHDHDEYAAWREHLRAVFDSGTLAGFLPSLAKVLGYIEASIVRASLES